MTTTQKPGGAATTGASAGANANANANAGTGATKLVSEQRRGGVIHLGASDGEALRVAEMLVGHGRITALPPQIDVAEPGPLLREAVARTFAAATMGFLLRGGRPQ